MDGFVLVAQHNVLTADAGSLPLDVGASLIDKVANSSGLGAAGSLSKHFGSLLQTLVDNLKAGVHEKFQNEVDAMNGKCVSQRFSDVLPDGTLLASDAGALRLLAAAEPVDTQDLIRKASLMKNPVALLTLVVLRHLDTLYIAAARMAIQSEGGDSIEDLSSMELVNKAGCFVFVSMYM